MTNLELGNKVRLTRDRTVIDPGTMTEVALIPKGTEGKVVDFKLQKREVWPDGRPRWILAVVCNFNGFFLVFTTSDNAVNPFDSFEVV